MFRISRTKLFLLLALAVLVVTAALPGMASAGSTTGWPYAGNPGFSSNPVVTDSLQPQVTSTSLFVYQGKPYVAYQDTHDDIVVSEYNNSSGTWQQVGDYVYSNTGGDSSVSLFVYDGMPSVAYQGDGGVMASVFNPGTGQWDVYGGNGNLVENWNAPTSISLFIYQDIPHVAYQGDGGVMASVYDSATGQWTNMGTAYGSTQPSPVSLFVDGSTGTPYVACQDNTNNVIVSSYNNSSSSWQQEGASISAGGYSAVSLFVYDGTPYVACQNSSTSSTNPNDIEVYYLSGIQWQNLGGASALQGLSQSSLSLFIDPGTGMPYVAYQDSSNNVEAYVYDQAKGWQQQGGASVGLASPSSTVSLYVDPGTPYVAYVDGAQGYAGYASVKYLPTNPVAVSVSPAGGGTVNGSANYSHNYEFNAPVTLTAQANSGYTFVNWTGGSGTVVSTANPYTFSMPASAVNLTADFTSTTQTYTTGGGNVVPALTVTPAAATVTVGSTEQYTATYYPYGQGSTGQDVTDDSQWSTGSQATAIVNKTGLATGVSPGVTDVFTGYDGLSAQATLTVAPPLTNLPAGAILDRSIGAVFAGQSGQSGGTVDGTTYQTGAPATITIPIDTRPPGPDYTIEVYHWQPLPLPGTNFPGRWVALATTMQNGQAVAVNDGNYTGWFAAWWVIKPHFTDIAGSWALNDIRRLNGLGMVEGYPGNGLDRPFGPDRPISRVELTTIAACILGLNPGTHAYTVLAPVPAGEAASILQKAYRDWAAIPGWAAPYVAAMTQAGYVHGMDGCFNANMPMTRIQAGVLMSNILRAVGYTTPADLAAFSDAGSIPAWARGRLLDDVLQGSDGLLRPNDTISRAEESTLCLRLFRTLGW